MHYERDAYKRLTSVRFDDEVQPRYVYDYDASGNVRRLTDTHLGETTSYESDFASRPGRAQTMAGDRHVYTQEVAYDGANRVDKARELVGENKTPYVTEYAYDSEDRPMEVTYGVPEKGMKYAYDSLGRLTARKLLDDASGYLTNYEYAQGGQGAGSTTALVQSIVQNGHSFTYTYDELGNIVCENRNGVETTYEYDRLGQLTRVNDPQEEKTTTYAYDRGGNILVKKVYEYTRGALPGTAITYDAIGNPLNDGTWAYMWKVGRQLEEMSKAGETVQFRYNAGGLCVRKESNASGVTEYILRGKQIAHLTRRDTEGVLAADMHFWYDAQGTAAMVSYNGKEYLYVYNVQGDVVALLDRGNSMAEVVEYHYDAWGRQVSCEGSMAGTLGVEQPFRYRGYVYDEETGLYYLKSRYYNPEWGRFINADSLISNGGLLSNNPFAYCENEPVGRRDPTGRGAFITKPAPNIDGIAPTKIPSRTPAKSSSSTKNDSQAMRSLKAGTIVSMEYVKDPEHYVNHFDEYAEAAYTILDKRGLTKDDGMVDYECDAFVGMGKTCGHRNYTVRYSIWDGWTDEVCDVEGCVLISEEMRITLNCLEDGGNPEAYDMYIFTMFHSHDGSFRIVVHPNQYLR